MEVSSSHQIYVFMLCVLSGMLCGVLFDLQRFVRRIHSAGRVRTAMEDIVFIILCSGIVLGFCFFFNDGEIRYYEIMGTVSGALFYVAALSRAFMWLLQFICRLFEKLIMKPLIRICRILFVPIKKIYGLLRIAAKKVGRILRRIKNNLQKRKKHFKKRIKML